MPAVEAARVAMIGVRSLDTEEREVLRRSQIRVVTMAEIDRLGMEAAVDTALDRLRAAGLGARLARHGRDGSPCTRPASARPCPAASATARRT